MPDSPTDKPHIVFCIKRMAGVAGGAERVLADVANGLADRGWRVTVLTFDPPEANSFYPLSAKVATLGLGKGAVRGKTGHPNISLQIFYLRTVLAKLNPDLAVGFLISMYVPLAFALIGSGIPVWASEHIVRQHYRNRRLQYLLIGIVSLFVARVTFLSPSIADAYAIVAKRKKIVIPNPVAPASCQAAPANGSAGKIILNVGRLVDFKDHRTLIQAFARLAPDFPEWTLRILGEGELRETLERLVEDLGLDDRVQMPGATGRIGAEYGAAKIFAIASIYEGFGLVTAEASSHGLPCIGFVDCPGTNDIITDGENGILVSTDDRVGNLAQGLRQMMTDGALRERMGRKGIENMTRYKLEKVLDRWEEGITPCLSSRSA